MDFKEIHKGLAELVSEGIKLEGSVRTDILSECLRILERASQFSNLHIGPDFTDQSELVYCKILAAAGILQENGDKMNPIYYTLTLRGRQFCGEYLT